MWPAGNEAAACRCGCRPRAGMPGFGCRAALGCRHRLPSVAGLGGMPQPFGGQGGECRVEVDAGELAAQCEGGNAGGAGAAERVEDHAAGLAASLDAAERDVDAGTRRSAGHGMGGWGWTRRRRDCARWGGAAAAAGAVPPRGDDLPGVRAVLGRPGTAAARRPAGAPRRPAIPRRRAPLRSRAAAGRGGVRHADGVEVEPVVPGLDEQEDQLVAAVEPVADGLGHGVGLVPDDGVAEDPPVVLEGERDPPGQAEQVLGRSSPARAARPGRPDVGVQAAGGRAAGRVGVARG